MLHPSLLSLSPNFWHSSTDEESACDMSLCMVPIHEPKRILQICLCSQLGLSVISKEYSEDAHKQ